VELAWKSRANQLAFALIKRLASVLVPIGFSFGEFESSAKAAFVQAATDQIRRGGKRPSTAKIAILTGLTRQEVAKIRSGSSIGSKASNEQRTERVMHGWFTDPRYIDLRGAPRPLPIKGEGSFDELVRRFGGDVPHKAVLEELIAGGMAKTEPRDVVRALRRHRLAPPPSALDLDALRRDIEIVFASVVAAPNSDASRSRRITVRFPSNVPKGVRRTVNVRAERFLEALSDYLHTESSTIDANPQQKNAIAFSILISQAEESELEQPDRRAQHD
jgi:hypothetical protein